MPQFNYRGQDLIRTRTGGVFTVILVSLVLLFAIVRFLELYSRHNPLIFQWHEDVVDEKMNLNEMGFRFALSIEDYLKPDEIKSSSKYVKWVF